MKAFLLPLLALLLASGAALASVEKFVSVLGTVDRVTPQTVTLKIEKGTVLITRSKIQSKSLRPGEKIEVDMTMEELIQLLQTSP